MTSDQIGQLAHDVTQELGDLLTKLRNLRDQVGDQAETEEWSERAKLAVIELLTATSSGMAQGQVDVQESIASMFGVSGKQSNPVVCALPYHSSPPHYFYSGRVCKNNPQHVFCTSHNLTVCVECGGQFK